MYRKSLWALKKKENETDDMIHMCMCHLSSQSATSRSHACERVERRRSDGVSQWRHHSVILVDPDTDVDGDVCHSRCLAVRGLELVDKVTDGHLRKQIKMKKHLMRDQFLELGEIDIVTFYAPLRKREFWEYSASYSASHSKWPFVISKIDGPVNNRTWIHPVNNCNVSTLRLLCSCMPY